jgi:hypothetical protein
MWRFTRDVGLNVLANLVAGAIIYLGGVLFNVFPGREGAVWASSVLLLVVGAAGVGVVAVSRFLYQARVYWRLLSIGSVLGGAGLFVGWMNLGRHGWQVPFACCILLILAGVSDRVSRIAPRPVAHRIAGLSWVAGPDPSTQP